jgi:virulence-associated protein VapD
MNKFCKTFLITLLVATSVPSWADTTTPKTLNLKAESNAANMDMVIKDNFIKAKFASAENRFLQGNVKASHDDYADLVSRAVHDDYVFLTYGIKMAEYGFFDLSDELFNKLDTNIYTQNYEKDIKQFYYPSGMVNPKDTIYLADAYASIVYNNLAIETTSELLNSTQAAESDYKNYLIALGYYKSNNLTQAIKYINNAIIENDVNISYKILKARILADSGKSKQALKVLSEIKKTEFLTNDFQNKIRAIEEYVEYKVAKDDSLKDYHLSYYYHLQDKSLLATKVLQSSIIKAKQYTPQIFGLLAKIYYDNDEPLKAQEFAQRAYKEDSKNYLATITLANLNFDDRKYEDALKYYKDAKKLTKTIEPSIGMAKSYLALDNTKKSKKIYEKLLKKHQNDEDVLIGSLKVFPQRADDYLAKIASVDISNNDMWLGLAQYAIKDGNYSMAETYLNNSYYIDENNFKYYYYLSLVLRAKGDIERSNQLLVKCSRLNSDYEADANPRYGVYAE